MTWVRSLSREDPLKKEMATHYSTLAWKIPWTEEPGRLLSIGSQRVRHDWATSLSFHLLVVMTWCSYFHAAAKSLRSCPTLCDLIDGSLPGSLVPGILQNTGVGCHFLLQCMKVKSESEVPESCPTLSNPMDCSLPDSSIHGIFQARVLEWGAFMHWVLPNLENIFDDLSKSLLIR